MKLILVLALVGMAVATASAALFDTRAQIEAKYGSPVQSKNPMKGSDESILYKKDSWNVQVEYIKGRAMRMAYWIVGHKLTKTEALALMKANTENSSNWNEKSSKTVIQWERSDHRAKAGLDLNGGSLWIASTDWLAAAAAKKKQDLGGVGALESTRRK